MAYEQVYQELTFDLPHGADRRFTKKKTSGTAGLQIVFNFICKLRIEERSRSQDSSNPIFQGLLNQIYLQTSVVLTLEQFHEFAPKILTDKLQYLRLDSLFVEAIVSVAVENAAKATRSMMSNFNTKIEIDVPVTVVETHLVEAEEGPKMVPALESAIEESLREVMKMKDEVEKCTVCLEQMEVGCKATVAVTVTLPCSHAFHGECINRWLQTSRSCPLCRFELPQDQIFNEKSENLC